jgi:hypothetical protein
VSISFPDAVHECFTTAEFMAEYRRLTGSTLGLDDRTPIARLVDEATGHGPWDGEWRDFFLFVRDFVWLPVVLAGETP